MGSPRTLLILGLCLFSASLADGQTVSVDQPGVCFECHSDVREQGGERHVHTAFRSGACTDCHNPHASRHAALLMEEESGLCLSCHDGIQAELARSAPHLPALKGECGRCHHPHASSHSGNLRSGMVTLCQSCHATVKEWMQRPKVHSPVAGGKCLSCHGVHGSQNEHLLESSVPSLCFTCHARDQRFTSAHEGRDIADADCVACHDPHSSTVRGLLRSNQHAPFAGGNCKTCHSVADGQKAFAIQGTIQGLCTKCHRGIKENEAKIHHHNLDSERSCVNCHNPHASNTGALLAAEQKVLCMRCHFNEPGRREKSRYLTHGGRDCSNCHLPHGSDNLKLLRTLEVDLCVRCHERAHEASHPVGPEIIDTRTGEPVTCLSCHQMHGAEFEKYLSLNPAMDLCIQCHRK